MAERTSALTHLSGSHLEGVALTEARYGSIVNVQAWPDTLRTVQAVLISELLDEDAPPIGSALVRSETVVASVAPGRYMLAGPVNLVTRLDAALPASDGTLTDLSHGRVILRLKGDAAGRVLQSCVMVDLDPATFPVGRVAQTAIHHIDVLIHRIDETAFEIWVLRSFAASLSEWLLDAGQGISPRGASLRT
jgi:sarcosine oxidase subunit gamma